MNGTDAVWAAGRLTIGSLLRAFTPIRTYGVDRVPRTGGVVLAFNHFSWIDPPVFGSTSPRTVYFMAKAEAHEVPGLGHLMRSFGTFSVRRGESDREAVRRMREVVRDGHALGLFVEGTRQLSGVPGEVKPGASMVALQEDVPIVAAAVHGTQTWRPGNWHPVSVAWGEPMRFDGLPRGARGYREASRLVQEELRRLWEFLVELHELGRPWSATPPALPRPQATAESAART
jgi:1-acyl-sn-glycerol-3-phosphate acyltransferase